MLQRVLPRHMEIIFEINHRFMRQVRTHWPEEPERATRMSIIEEGPVQHVRMAHLAALGSHSVNGVAKLHTELIKRDLLPDFYGLFPDRFNNKTNGVTPRRWLLYSNPVLAQLLSERFGDEWIAQSATIAASLAGHAADTAVLDHLLAIKLDNKRVLATCLKRLTGIEVDPQAMFIAQIKRIHEYKRQLLAALEAIAHYMTLKQTPSDRSQTPRVYIFAGKAAAGYAVAKSHIRLLNDVAAVLNADPETNDRLKMVFVPNYGVSLAQVIIPAVDVSLQISQAGKEASGTSNMKLALNGALTVGTLDGANVEIRDAVGHENFFLCGLTLEEVQALQRSGYDAQRFIAASPRLERALHLLESGFFSVGDEGRYRGVVDSLRRHDPYMVCADFESYVASMAEASEVFSKRREWARRSLYNIVGAASFSSDATIRAYASEIWHLTPITDDARLARASTANAAAPLEIRG
jgi:starch phosphorylase